MMDTILAVDPGLRGVGLAYFGSSGKLQYANYIANPVLKGGGPEAWFALADTVFHDLKNRGHRVDVYVVELMQIYRGSPGDPNDLLELAGVGAAIGATFPIKRAIGFRPREWKGTAPKEIHHPRILIQLYPAETAAIEEKRKSYAGHVYDAIGLGLYELARLGLRFP